jgi:magnesium-transporting ATPase (P-type)
MTHAAVVTTQIGNGFAQRTNVQSIFKVGPFSNKFLLWGIAGELVVISLLIYVPFLAKFFNHGPIDAVDWAYLFCLVPALLVADEIRKFFVRRRLRGVVKEVKEASR